MPSARFSCLVLALGSLLASCAEQGPQPSRTVVLISIDTLRAERLGIYGNSADVSPNIDALARDSVVFDSALSVAPWTLPSHASMLTGFDAVALGVESPSDRIPTRVITAAEAFSAKGFATAAWTAGGFVDKGWGLEDGFSIYDTNNPWRADGTGFSRYLDRALGWMREQDDKPFFVFLHSFDAHGPYDQSDPSSLARMRAREVKESDRDHEFFRATYTDYARGMRFDRYQRLGEALNDYDSGVADADRAVGEVVAELKRLGRYDDALILVLSDHGESFYDYGMWMGHGMQLRDNVLRVPLVMKLPRSELGGTRIDSLVDLVDVTPTLLDVAGIAKDPRAQGSSLAGIARGGKRSRSWSMSGTHSTATHALVRGPYKYIGEAAVPPVISVRNHIRPETPPVLQHLIRGEPFRTQNSRGESQEFFYPNIHDPLGYFEDVLFLECLFDRRADPGERTNLAATHPAELEDMRKSLKAIYAESRRLHQELAGDEGRRQLTVAEARQLNELGYAVAASDDAQLPTGAWADAFNEELDRTRKNPPQPPPNSELLADYDRRVHRLRVKLRDRGSLDEADARELAACAVGVAEWLEQTGQPRWGMRAMWRVLEIRALAQAAGFDLAPFDLEERLRQFVLHKNGEPPPSGQESTTGTGDAAEDEPRDGR